MNKNPGRRQRRQAEREANRKDGRERNQFSVKQGQAFRVFRAGRKRTA
jgi:hypothetical protein